MIHSEFTSIHNIGLGQRFIRGQVTLYADDTNVIVTGSSMEELLENCHVAFNELNIWFFHNKINLNYEKTKLIILGKNDVDLVFENVELTADGVNYRFFCELAVT